MMSGKNGARQIIEAFATIFTFIALFGRFFFIESSFDYSLGITKRTLASLAPFRPAQFPNSFITLSIINQRLYVYLHQLGSYGELSQKIYPLPLYDPETQHEPIFYVTQHHLPRNFGILEAMSPLFVETNARQRRNNCKEGFKSCFNRH